MYVEHITGRRQYTPATNLPSEANTPLETALAVLMSAEAPPPLPAPAARPNVPPPASVNPPAPEDLLELLADFEPEEFD